jgi:DNA polymerase III subunit beta
MKLNINVKGLRTAVDMLTEVAAHKDTIPVLRTAELNATKEPGLLQLAGTNLDQTIFCDVEASVSVEGTAIVPVRQLSQIVQAVSDGDLQVEHADQRLSIRQGSLEYELSSWGDSFPESPKFGATPIKVKSESLRTLIGHTEFAVIQEQGRYTLSGAKVIIKPSELTMVATDGHRLALGVINVKSTKEYEVLIPREALKYAVKLSRHADNVSIGFSEEHLFLKVGSFRLISRLLAGQFPFYEAVYPRAVVRTVTLNAKALCDCISRTSIMADERSHSVRLTFNGDSVAVTAEDPNENKAKDSIAISGEGEPLAIVFNGRYMEDFLSRLGGDVALELTDATTQVRMRPTASIGLNDYFHILMPMLG